MDVLLRGCDGLDAFERTIYEGVQQFAPIPSRRWQALASGSEAEAPPGSFLDGFEVDLKLPNFSALAGSFHPKDLLLARVVQRAAQDARLASRSGLKTALLLAGEAKPAGALPTIPQATPPLNGKFAGALAGALGFSGPVVTLAAGGNLVAEGLIQAKRLLTSGAADAVVLAAAALLDGYAKDTADWNTGAPTLGFDAQVNGLIPGEGAIALVFQMHSVALADDRRIYAVVQAASYSPAASPEGFSAVAAPETVAQCCRQALQTASLRGDEVGYVETCASGIQAMDEAEITGLLRAYRTLSSDLTCALGSVQSNVGSLSAAAGLAGLARAALCVSHRFLPGTSQWHAPRQSEAWAGSPFYVPPESRAWFVPRLQQPRIAGVNVFGPDGSFAHLLLSEEIGQPESPSRALEQAPFYLFPLAASGLEGLLARLETLKRDLSQASDLASLARSTFADFVRQPQAAYCVGIVGHDPGELLREVEFAVRGIPNAFQKHSDWQTPGGSYFTPEPLGQQGGVAFVYPGAFNSYIGMGKDLFHLFPRLYERIARFTTDAGKIIGERRLYPRSLAALSKEQLDALEAELNADPIAMLTSGTSLAVLYTLILEEVFAVKPQAAFGYSLGENSMIFASGVWANGDEVSTSLEASPLFHTRLSGPQNAVREYWGLAPQPDEYADPEFWTNYVLMAPSEKVLELLDKEPHVYLTHINTPRQVVIAGEKAACQRVVAQLQCSSLRAPFNYALHCRAIASEYPALARLHHWPVANATPGASLYSAASYGPLPIESTAIAESLARMLTSPLDFPRLVQRVYAGGARIFIELGAGSNCAKWIDETLKGSAHLAMSIDRRGVNDHPSIVRVLARLASHRAPCDLSPLYSPEEPAEEQGSSARLHVDLSGPQPVIAPANAVSDHAPKD